MNDRELTGKVHSAVYHQCRSRGFAVPVDVLMDVGYLSKQDYENWRYGRVDYLERVCKANLSKLSLVMRKMRTYAEKAGKTCVPKREVQGFVRCPMASVTFKPLFQR